MLFSVPVSLALFRVVTPASIQGDEIKWILDEKRKENKQVGMWIGLMWI